MSSKRIHIARLVITVSTFQTLGQALFTTAEPTGHQYLQPFLKTSGKNTA
jgi:hypothetical protein